MSFESHCKLLLDRSSSTRDSNLYNLHSVHTQVAVIYTLHNKTVKQGTLNGTYTSTARTKCLHLTTQAALHYKVQTHARGGSRIL